MKHIYRRVRMTLFLVTVAAMSVLGDTVSAEELMITEVKAPILDLWSDEEATDLVAEFPREDVSVPLKVEKESSSQMLLVTVDGKSGWVFPHLVKLNRDRKAGNCDQLANLPAVGAVRGAGGGCE